MLQKLPNTYIPDDDRANICPQIDHGCDLLSPIESPVYRDRGGFPPRCVRRRLEFRPEQPEQPGMVELSRRVEKPNLGGHVARRLAVLLACPIQRWLHLFRLQVSFGVFPWPKSQSAGSTSDLMVGVRASGNHFDVARISLRTYLGSDIVYVYSGRIIGGGVETPKLPLDPWCPTPAYCTN